MGSSKMKLLVILSLIFAHAYYVQGICCPWKVTSDVKCACDDGGLVHPWECCSTGACNVFCCNCGGPCRENSTVRKRSVGNILEAYNKFNMIDVDEDGILVPREVLLYLGDKYESLANT